MFELLCFVCFVCVVNLIFTMLMGMNIIQLREYIQFLMEVPPREVEDLSNLNNIETSQQPYSAEPMLED